MRVVTFGTYDKRTHPRIAILIEGLRGAGDHVVEVNAPLGIGTNARVDMLRRPSRAPMLLARLCRRWVQLTVNARRLGPDDAPDVVIVGYLGQFDIHLARLLFHRRPIVLDQLVFAVETAQDRGVASRWKLALLGRIDSTAVARADVVLVDTSERCGLPGPGYHGRVVPVPVGAPERWFAAGGRRAPRQPGQLLRVVFFGLYTPLQGTPVIGAALAKLADAPDIEVTMIGRGQDLDRAKSAAHSNERVIWREWVDADELPGVLADSDVCLGIFGTGPKALSVVPNKVYQGAAAGCAIITSDTGPQRHALGDDAAYYVPAGDSEALAGALRRLAGDPTEVKRLQIAARQRAESRFRPASVVQPLREQLAALVG
jgi:glycosyltransferase involved in cell wall biosynthesis